MMRIEIKLVALAGEYMESAQVMEWLKGEGDPVAVGEPLIVVETAKAAVQIEAPASGVLEKILVEPGQEVPVGTVLGIIAVAAEAARPAAVPPGPDAPAARAPHVAPTSASVPHSAAGSEGTARAGAGISAPGFVRASPRARTLARQMGLDLAAIPSAGPGGRVSERDVLRAAGARGVIRAVGAAMSTSAGPASTAPHPPAAGITVPSSVSPSAAVRVPFRAERPTGYRRAMAERMAQSAQVPQFAISRHLDAARMEAMRGELKARAARGGPVPGVTDVIVKAVAVALRQHHRVNAQWNDGQVLFMEEVNVGVAVATDRGLVVPVVKHADRRSILEIAEELAGLRERAVAFRLRPEDLDGGTFTVSNLGMMGVERFTALVNPPQAAILAVGAVYTRPVWDGGGVHPQRACELTLTADHRVLDGADAAAFLDTVTRALEDPGALVS